MNYRKFSLLIFLIIILLGGCNVNPEDNFDEETKEKLKSVTERYIQNNFESIELIEMEDPYISPMGGTKVDGTVNGKAGFSVTINEDYTVAGISQKEGFPNRKNECKEKACDY